MSFNPALYVKKMPDGTLELPLFARMLWLNAERPGWRITSEKFSVVAIEIPEGQEKAIRYVAIGHVSVIDEQGRKVLSVPSSTEVDSPFFAEDLFRFGAELALDILGFHVRNIPAECWERVNLPSVKPKPKESAPANIEIEPEFNLVEEQVFEEQQSVDFDSPDETEALFLKILQENPTGLGFLQKEVSEGNPMELLNRYCYKITGLPWNVAEEAEKRMVRDCLEKLA